MSKFFSNLWTLLCITFPQGVWKSKNVGQIWDHFVPILFPKDSEPLQFLDIRLWEVCAKKMFKWYLTSEQTDRHTYIWTNRLIESIGLEDRCFKNKYILFYKSGLGKRGGDKTLIPFFLWIKCCFIFFNGPFPYLCWATQTVLDFVVL